MAEDAVEALCKHLRTNRPDMLLTGAGEYFRREQWWSETERLISAARKEHVGIAVMLATFSDEVCAWFESDEGRRASDVALAARMARAKEARERVLSWLDGASSGAPAQGDSISGLIEDVLRFPRGEARLQRDREEIERGPWQVQDGVFITLERGEIVEAFRDGCTETLFRGPGHVSIRFYPPAPKPAIAWRCRPGWVLCGACKELQPWADPAHETQACRKCGALMEPRNLPDDAHR